MAKAAIAAAKDDIPTDSKDPPWHKARIGLMQIASWQNLHTDSDGERVYRTFTLKRSFQREEGKWEETKITLSERDLGPAIALLQNAQQALIKPE